jgi:hypothetical protein
MKLFQIGLMGASLVASGLALELDDSLGTDGDGTVHIAFDMSGNAADTPH